MALRKRASRRWWLAAACGGLLTAGAAVVVLVAATEPAPPGHPARASIGRRAPVPSGTAAPTLPARAASTPPRGSASAHSSSAPRSAGHYQVKGRFLYDPCGQKVTIRGVENQFWNPWLYPDGSIIPEIARTGAKTVRIVAYYPPEQPPTGGIGYLTVAQIEYMIKLAIGHHMIPDVAIAGGKFPDVYLRGEVKRMLLRYQDKILIHMMGEGTQNTTRQWISEAKANIAALRAAGYTAPLYVLADYYGRQLPTILSGAAQVVASDPLRNVIFGWQAHWGEPGDYYQHLFGMTLHQAMQKVRDAPYMIQVGLTYQADPSMNDDLMDYHTAMRDAQSYDIGWLWWDWRLSSGTASLTTDGIYGHWEPYGQDVAVTNAYGIANTSRRTTFLNTGGRCG